MYLGLASTFTRCGMWIRASWWSSCRAGVCTICPRWRIPSPMRPTLGFSSRYAGTCPQTDGHPMRALSTVSCFALRRLPCRSMRRRSAWCVSHPYRRRRTAAASSTAVAAALCAAARCPSVRPRSGVDRAPRRPPPGPRPEVGVLSVRVMRRDATAAPPPQPPFCRRVRVSAALPAYSVRLRRRHHAACPLSSSWPRRSRP
jgi:hypothetical protein